jgi:hypothetical protein
MTDEQWKSFKNLFKDKSWKLDFLKWAEEVKKAKEEGFLSPEESQTVLRGVKNDMDSN